MRELIRKAGSKLREFDEAYAARVRQDNKRLPLSQQYGGTALGKPSTSGDAELAMAFAREGEGPASKGMVQRHQAMEYALGLGGLATNAGYRYGLPAAGLTLAGEGLRQLTAEYGSQADQPESSTLPM